MSNDNALIKFIGSTDKSINDALALIKFFNEPEWPENIKYVLSIARHLLDFHGSDPRSTVVDDYDNLGTLLAQIPWPNFVAENDEISDRLRLLRGAIGSLRLDIDCILRAGGEIGLTRRASFNIPIAESKLISKEGRETIAEAILTRLGRVENVSNLEMTREGESDRPHLQAAIVSHYRRTLKLNIEFIRGTLNMGNKIDLGVLERASSAMEDATNGFLFTIRSISSKATDALREAGERINIPIQRLVQGVRTFVKFVRYKERFTNHGSEIAMKLNDAAPGTDQGNLPNGECAILVGARLKLAREKNNLTILDISKRTRINERYIRALEDGEYELLPFRVYIIGFMRSYARVVGEDEVSIINDIRSELRNLSNQHNYF